jgi:riboflavin kinase/FMN adenylyltransferase
MRVFRHWSELPAALKGGAIAIGNFDGLHRGHEHLIALARDEAASRAVPAGVLTFEPHPRRLFRPGDPPFRLSPFRMKMRRLAELGLDYAMVLHFDAAFASTPAETFIAEILTGGLGVSHITVGEDFRFGHKRGGDVGLLRAAGIETTACFAVCDETAEPISSSRVRSLLTDGKPRAAARLLGRVWETEGRVQKGDQRGRELGYPTANIPPDLDVLQPKFGIYAIRAQNEDAPDSPWIPGVANWGIRPMYALEAPLLEAHLFDFSGDLYGKHLRIRWVEYLRGEAKFDGLEALIAQMDRDAAAARAALAAPSL